MLTQVGDGRVGSNPGWIDLAPNQAKPGGRTRGISVMMGLRPMPRFPQEHAREDSMHFAPHRYPWRSASIRAHDPNE